MFSIQDSLQYFKGVGPKKAKLFKKIEISTAEDLLYYFPFRYEDRSNFVNISQLEIGKVCTIKGEVLAKSDKTSWKRRGFHIFEMALGDDHARIFAVWFNQPYLNQYFKVGQKVILFGKVELYKDRLQISNPEFEILDENEDENDALGVGRIVPIYSTTEGITQRFLRQLIKNALDKYIPKIIDPLPYDIRKKHNLLNLAQSLISIHFPNNEELKKQAYQRLSFEEFFMFQIPVILRKIKKKQKQGIVHKIGGQIFSQLINSLPFALTEAQIKALEEIKKDMSSLYPMQRLLEGEVGSGKTIVAILAAAIALDGGYQAAFMAPTEILAKQHYDKIRLQIADCRLQNQNNEKIRIALLVSSLKKKEKEKIYNEIKEGEINLVVGTHALIQEDLSFKNLGLVVIDEQHKFGVTQRALLPKKGNNPDLLIMTATPIPRTLSMTIYGDLDISIINELPKGRLPIKTLSYNYQQIDEAYKFVKSLLKQKRQSYFICPVIEESQEEDLKAAEVTFKEFKEDVFKEFSIGLIHGRIKPKESDQVMSDFKDGKIDVLVATSVLEVGIDIPNACCMAVLQAERFGLSQLHQLRGRIGRGENESFFMVICEPKTQEAKLRIKAIEELSDGFRIAEEDLRIRGPGEFFGRRQHGLSALKIANPVTQMRLLKCAREEAVELIKNDLNLSKRQNQELAKKIKNSFPDFPNLDVVV